MSEKLWSKLIKFMGKAGPSFPVNNTLIEILQMLLTVEQAKFLLIFEKPTLTIDQIKERTDLDDNTLLKLLNELMQIGITHILPDKNTGIMTYHLMSVQAFFDQTLMRGGMSEKEKILAKMYTKLYGELKQGVQSNYDRIIPLFKNALPRTRIVPVEEKVDVQQQIVLPYEAITQIVEKYDTFGLGHCFCRQRKNLIGDPCKLGTPKLSCMSLGETAQFLIEHDFMKPISKEEALKFLKKSEELGLVHNLMLIPDDPEYGEIAICSCCKCCCGILSQHHSGLLAMNTLSSYLAKVNAETCVGCGTCVEKCPMEAIELHDTVAFVNEDRCIGCGICAHHCPEESMTLNRTGLRNVFVPPPRLINV